VAGPTSRDTKVVDAIIIALSQYVNLQER